MKGPARFTHGREHGQALAEGLAALAGMLALYMAVSWLGRYQDMALQAAHASRFAAFSLTRNDTSRPISQIRRHYFSGPAHQWMNRDGTRVLGDSASDVALAVSVEPVLQAQAQPGGADPLAQRLRQGLRVEDTGIAHALVSLRFPLPSPASSYAHTPPKTDAPGLPGWRYPPLERQTAILIGAGHASSDTRAQDRVADSVPAWQDSAMASYALGRRIASAMTGVDRAWNRGQPVFDWLRPWAGHIPGHHLAHPTIKEAP